MNIKIKVSLLSAGVSASASTVYSLASLVYIKS